MTTITTNSTKGITLSTLDTTIASGVSISNTSGKTVVDGASPTAWTLVNYGRIIGQNKDAVALYNGGYVTNAGPGVISDKQAVYVNGAAGTVVNAGSLIGTVFGVHLVEGGLITNATGGLITGGSQGVYVNGTAAGTVVNAGSIGGGVYLYGGGLVTNADNAAITGGQGVYFGNGVTGEVNNAGSITATSGSGIKIEDSGSVTNSVSGVITGQQNGVEIATGAGMVANLGTITAASEYYGVKFLSGGYVGNGGSGLISGTVGVYIAGAAGTVVNAGSIIGSGGTAVAFAKTAANRLIVDPGAVFGGSVVAQGTSNVLELASAASTGTIAGIGTSFLGFGAVEVDTDARWVVSGAVSGGTIDIAAGSDLTLTGAEAASAPVDFTANSGTLGVADPTDFAATVFGFQPGDAIDFTTVSSSGSITAGVNGSNELTLTSGGTLLAEVQLDPGQNFAGTIFTATPDGSGGDIVTTTLCFCAGTMIATPAGETPVEQLAVGDQVLTAHGTVRPVVWIGVGQVLATRGRRGAATPVIVRRNALADNVPHRDLHVTKGHSVYLDSVLIPVEFLVNHRSILWDDQAQMVSLYHIELEAHDVLLANGAPLESYRDDGNRWLFQNANAAWGLAPKEHYAPVLTGGPVVDEAWRRLLDRSGTRNGFPLTDDPDLHLLVDGIRLDALERTATTYTFNLLNTPSTIRIVSRAAAPQELGLARDPRSLGVALRRISVRRAAQLRIIEAEDPQLTLGFHAFEPDNGFRWTDGDSVLPVELFSDFATPAILILELWSTARYVADGDANQQAA